MTSIEVGVDGGGIWVYSGGTSQQYLNVGPDELAAVRTFFRQEFADELTRKGVYSFDIHSIRKYAKEDA